MTQPFTARASPKFNRSLLLSPLNKRAWDGAIDSSKSNPMNIRAIDTQNALKQGDLYELCGAYAIINAIRLSASSEKMDKRTQRDLAKTALRFLSKREMLQETSLHGMGSRSFMKLADKLVARANLVTNTALRITTLSGTGMAPEEFIKSELSRNAPLCARLKGPFDHYTVISGMTDTRYLLTDSSGLSWINRSSLKIRTGSASARFKIQSKSLFSISSTKAAMNSIEQTDGSSKRLWEIDEDAI